MSVPQRGGTLAQASACVEEVARLVGETADLSAQTHDRLVSTLTRFAAFAERGFGVSTLSNCSPDIALAFITAPSSGGEAKPPSISTMHFRRSAVRLLFREARRVGLSDGDPTLDLALPPRSSLRLRPLTDDEVAICRSSALRSLSETRLPSAFALAEATVRTSEIPRIRVEDVHLAEGRVWIHGGSKTADRWGTLSSWGAEQLARRLRRLAKLPTFTPIVYEGRGSAQSAQASACVAISTVLRAAGLGSEPDVRPASIAAWSGATTFRQGAQIEEVARVLGVRSLDQAARLIGWDWDGEEEA
jgi:integrase